MAADSPVALIDPALPDYFEALRACDIKIGLNTGYPPRLQYALLSKLSMHEMVDAFVSAKEGEL